MQEFDHKMDQQFRSVKFKSNNKSKQVSFKECQLKRVHDLTIHEDSNNDRLHVSKNNNFKRKNHNDSVQTINIKCTNAASNETSQVNPSNGTNEQATYDNPTFESDITIQNQHSNGSQL